ncbi:hypothetical protein TREMEDRAFT_28713 [Tremella mesenterica DSM 1558]|uniref:uncharacterized protein n=1 Tax=Tremella mesenterica (strain ATCC 24925 / CBS 8224 / DSM 1558 / NBRC 9311 / NRRL Y-6157 / RJB 2259-6 / UBC 559-6) TaxID=578456 RepID=UPI0003F493C1|nr:uncharacterized protein TREMEDRAFT_28713 [Tremella mesenterica DSM 1558]EIW70412.1 hypothetical protein TREMEDRAFT_28713 [Tremella mesenterica DSM 1558]
MNLTPDQARALFEAGGFLIVTGLPPGSSVSLDGSSNVISNFSGYKFLPPGLHLFTYFPSSSSQTSTSQVDIPPIRSAFIRVWSPRQRIIISYSPKTETISPSTTETVILDDHLKTLDPHLAGYDFSHFPLWRLLTSEIDQRVLDDVIGSDGRVDGLTLVNGETDDFPELAGEREKGEEVKEMEEVRKMNFPMFDLRRSWKDGAVGEEVTRYSMDKSWLLGNVIRRVGGADPMTLLAHFQLSFILFLHISSYSCLTVYRRLLSLFCRSSSFFMTPEIYLLDHHTQPSPMTITTTHSPSLPSSVSSPKPSTLARQFALTLLSTLSAQLKTLPPDVFQTELPDMDVVYQDELAQLHNNLCDSLGRGTLWSKESHRKELETAWERLRDTCMRKGWSLGRLDEDEKEAEEEEEEGEYAPVVVDI